MSIRWTEEEALSNGWQKDLKGNWISPGVHRRDSSEMPKLESGARSRAKKAVGAEEKAQRDSSKGNRFRIGIWAYCRRHRDPDNLCAKWYIDELVRQGIIPDDSSRFIESVFKRVVKIGCKETERIVIWVLKYDG